MALEARPEGLKPEAEDQGVGGVPEWGSKSPPHQQGDRGYFAVLGLGTKKGFS